MNDAIGYRGWCKKCRHGVTKGDKVSCSNKNSQFYNMDTTCVLCTPCLTADKSKNDVAVEPISFD